MTNRFIKRYQISLIIKLMKITTAMIYHLTCIKRTIIKKTRDNKRRPRYGEKRTSHALLEGMQADTATIGNSMEVPQKVPL